MQRAIELAKKGQFTTRPNPCVGCVIVKDGQIIGEGYHYQAGQPHAEVFALRQAGEQATGATAYVTLEPCSHYGRTPPCALALIKAGIAGVVIAVIDPNPKVTGRGIELLQQAGIQVTTGVCQTEAYTLNQGFLRTMAGGLPYVRLKTACSLDGRIAMQSGESKWITGESSRQDVQQLRARVGAIITGSQTVLADNPQMNIRSTSLDVPLTDIPQPALVVLDRRGRINSQCDWCQQQRTQRELILVQTPYELRTLLTELRDIYQIHDVLVEAGAQLSSAFLQAGLVDEWIIYQAPCLLGVSAKPMITFDYRTISEQLRFKLVSHETIDNDLKLVFRAC